MPVRPGGPPVPVGDDRSNVGRITPRRDIDGELTLHLLNQEQRFTNTRNGPVVVVSGILENLSGPAETRLIDAGLAPDMPRVGDFHHYLTDLPVDDVDIAPVDGSPSKAYVRIRYAYPTGSDGFTNFPDETAPPQIEIVSAVVPMTTEFCYATAGNNINKNQIVLLHITEEDETSIPHYQVGEVEVQVPVEIVRYRRRENVTATALRTKARDYVGTINKEPIFPDSNGVYDVARMWLCTRLGGPSDDGGLSYNVTYEFQRNVDGWDKVVVFRNPDTGYPMQIPLSGDNQADPNLAYNPSDLKMAAKCRVHREMDFFGLGLTV